jgi:hypothetical protein
MGGTMAARWREALEAHEKLDTERHLENDRALRKAEIAMDKRLDSLNEFREQLADQQRTFLPRAEYNGRHDQLEARIDDIQTRLIAMTSRLDEDVRHTDRSDRYRLSVPSILFAAMGVAVAIVSLFVALGLR